ncbi:MAG: hypothetical protein ACXIVL_02510 [Oceanicaulis sp.]
MLRAAFWIAVVAAFAPAGFSAPENGAFAREAQAILSAPAREAALAASSAGHQAEAGFCADHGELCAVGRSLAGYASLVTDAAAERARASVEARVEIRSEAQRTEDIFARAAGE